MRRQALGAASVMFALAAAGCATGTPASLDGVWTATEVSRDGKPVPALIGHVLRFDGDRFEIARDGKRLFGGRFETTPDTSPPAIDFHQTASPQLAGTWRGIYSLVGNVLKICDNAYALEKPRPKRFEDCAAPGYVMFRFERAK